jgi:hypothetical protein
MPLGPGLDGRPILDGQAFERGPNPSSVSTAEDDGPSRRVGRDVGVDDEAIHTD